MSIKIRKKPDSLLFDNWDKCGLSKDDWFNLHFDLVIEVDSIPDEIKDMVDVLL